MFRFLTILVLLLFTACANAEDLVITDKEDNDISVQVYPADSDILIIWLVDHINRRDMFEEMLNDVHQAGIEIWRVDLLRDYFLTRSSENQRTLSGDGVEALIRAAHDFPHKHIVLAGYDKMPLAILRGIYQWHKSNPEVSRLAGTVFFYPNLYGPTPVAGEDPVLDPIVDVTTVPIMIYQPDSGYLRLRINQIMERFWEAGTQAFVYLVPDVRDWFFMGGEIDHGPGDKEATARIPQQLKHFTKLMANLMADLSENKLVQPELKKKAFAPVQKELVTFRDKPIAPGFSLTNEQGTPFSFEQYEGKVLLVNFWATWCPPCVEEIPSLNALQVHYLDSEFEIVSINYRETAEQLHKFTLKIPVNFPVLMDFEGETSLLWKVFSFPSSFLVDKNGKVRQSINQAIDWNSPEVHKVIDKLLKE